LKQKKKEKRFGAKRRGSLEEVGAGSSWMLGSAQQTRPRATDATSLVGRACDGDAAAGAPQARAVQRAFSA